MASSTRSAFRIFSDPATSTILPSLNSTRTVLRPVTLPFSPMNSLVEMANSRSQPSSWLELVRSLIGQSGQVSGRFSSSGGWGINSNWVTLTAPWRLLVPTQSLPVSPPPITMTCLPSARNLLCCRHARRARAHHGHLLARFVLGNAWLYPALLPRTVNDRVLDGLDAHCVVVHIEHAGGLAGCVADAAGELGEVVGAVQHLDRALPVRVVHQIVEVRNDVVHRAAVVAERRAAVHAARALHLGLAFIQPDDKFLVMLQALGHRLVALFDALVFHEAGSFSHDDVLVYECCAGICGAALLGGDRFFFGSSYRWCSGLLQHFSFINFSQRTLVLGREDLDELAARCGPVVEQFACALAARPAVVVFQQLLELGFVGLSVVPDRAWHRGFLLGGGQDALQRHHGHVAAGAELTVFVVHVCRAAAHARRKVAAGLAKHHHGAPGHVFATVVVLGKTG